MSEYTKGKWFYSEQGCIVSDNGIMIADIGFFMANPVGNAERICQCVNNFDKLKQQRDDLLAACKEFIKDSQNSRSTSDDIWLIDQAINTFCKLIAQIEKEGI